METVRAYAKINLALEVVKKTKKNYHKLKMIMSEIELYDLITFEPCDDIVVCTNKFICDMEQNLCYKIAKYLQTSYKITKGIRIRIEKNIPDGGGLGGGSSDAAAVLKYLNKYWRLNLNKRKLKKIAFNFGCDIPFFIEGGLSYVTGYGEKIKKLKKRCPIEDIILVLPPFKNNTKQVFEHCLFNEKGKKIQSCKKVLKQRTKKEYIMNLFNELQIASDKYNSDKVKKIIDKINEDGRCRAIMSGSGSTVVCYVFEKKDVEEVFENLKLRLTFCDIIKTKVKVE